MITCGASNIGLGTVACAFSRRFWRLCRGQVLAGKVAEDLFSADLAPGQVDLQRRGARLSGCELVKGAVWPGGVVVLQVLGQDLAQVVCVPKTSSTSCDQAIFVDQPTDASLSSDAALTGIDRLR
jgi:hypothetical protein